MTGRTHDLAGFTLLNLAFVSLPLPTMTVSTAIGALGMVFIGALTPDIDQPTADLWRRLPAGNIIGRIISPILGSHRMISHSFLGLLLFGYGSFLLFERLASVILIDMSVVWFAFMTGFVSHILIDLLNRDGIPIFFPFPWKFGIPPLRGFRIKAGGMVEKTILYPLLMLTNAYIVSTHYQIYLEFLKNNIK
jgi:inner membrane protein